MSTKNIILFVKNARRERLDSLSRYGRSVNKKFRTAIIYNSKSRVKKDMLEGKVDIVLSCDLDKPLSIVKILLPYQDEIVAVTCHSEANIQDLIKIIPHLPYLKTSTTESLQWSTDKLTMRERLRVYNKNIAPKFTIVSSVGKQAIKKIKDKVGFPLVLKPAALASSLLVSICFHEEELEATLKKAFKKIQKIYKDNKRQVAPKILVEQFMEGEMYSIDGYVTSRGRVYFCPLVYVKTGRAIGFDDFFGYQQMTPTMLKKDSISQAQEVSLKAIHALGLRSTTAHVELMKTEEGWKVIEVGPRIGGFRHRMYQLSYGIDHSLNDILIRLPQKPIIFKKVKGYTAAMKFFAKTEGRLIELKGIKKIRELASFRAIRVNKEIGDQCVYAKHGGKSVFDLILFNKERAKLLADIRRIEQSIVIKTSRGK